MVADSMPAMIGYVDRSLRYRFLNARYGEWFGVDPKTMVGIHMRDLLGQSLYEARLPYIERVLRGESVHFERASEHPRFGQRATEVVYVPHTGFDGTIEGFYVMGFDVTERKRTEQTLRIRARQQHAVAALGKLALREPELQQVFEHATRSVAETLEIEYCKILEVLPGADRLLLRAGVGWKEELVGRLHIGAGIDSQAGYALLCDGPVVVNDLREERRFTDMTLLTDHGVVSGMTCLITGANGAPWGVIGAHAGRPIKFSDDDVSFLAAVANTLSDAILRQRAEQALRENDRRKDEFLAMLSHELRNPLAPLKNSLHVLRLLAEGNAAVSSVHAIMERQMGHLVRLVDDLLEVSRISRGAFELRREPVDLATVVRNAVETSEPHMQLARHRFRVSVPDQPLWLDGDPVRLAQILSNLLNNAAKYTPEGGEIRLEAREENGWVRIAVCDSGIGIRPQALPGIFEMFGRGDQAAESEGPSLGIGLSLARRLAQMHGGDVEAHSEGEGRGSEFVVRLPLGSEQGPPVAAAVVRDAAVKPRKILVVDDNHDSADSLGMLLEALGAEVQVAHGGVEALDAYQSFQPDVVLLDIGMPGMDGYEVARRIRASAGGGRILLVAVSGWGKEEDRRRARAAGFDHHLTKPADFGSLQALLAAGKSQPCAVHAGAALTPAPLAAGSEAQRAGS
jgi:PAS domain S-box-containing protein